jgi:hypothetical protein
MVSRSQRFQREQNRFSILLSQVRRFLPRHRYQSLLAMRRAGDNETGSTLDSVFEEAWLEAISAALDQAFQALEKGNPGRSGYVQIGHLYRDYFMALFQAGLDPTSRKLSTRR